MSYYRAISCAEQSLTLKKIRHEMEDCYGLLPNSVIALLQVREVNSMLQSITLKVYKQQILQRQYYYSQRLAIYITSLVRLR